MLRNRYHELRSYCWYLVGEYKTDLLHDAYLYWWEKKKKNLFDEPRGVASQVIRNVFGNQLQHKYYMLRGVKYLRNFVSTSPDEFGNELLLTTENPHDILEQKELLTVIGQDIGMILDGYSQVEIARSKGVTPQAVNYHITKNKKKIMSVLNPIAGSRVKLLKKLSKLQFDKLEDRNEYKNTLEGNETVDIYVKDIDAYHQSGQAEGILVKLTKD